MNIINDLRQTEIEYIISKEKMRQEKNIELIASENFVSDRVMQAVGSCLINKYAEGYENNRYYGGCTHIDEIEHYCKETWKTAFNTDYEINVQPHSGSNANYAALSAVMNPGDALMSLDLNHGGHLTHGSPVNFSGKLYNCFYYGVDSNGFIDMDDVRSRAKRFCPKVIIAGASAYSRFIDFKEFADIANEVHAILIADIAHIAGLIIAGKHPSPFEYADIITTTTHKTLRGPRGGMILCKPEYIKRINSAVFPGIQGGPLMHVIAGKAVAAEEACTDEYKIYICNVVANATSMANKFTELGYHIVTGGTDNHLFLIDLPKSGIDKSGKEVQDILDRHLITLNKNCIPGETRSPKETSGIRIGTPAMTTRGYTPKDFMRVAETIDRIIRT